MHKQRKNAGKKYVEIDDDEQRKMVHIAKRHENTQSYQRHAEVNI